MMRLIVWLDDFPQRQQWGRWQGVRNVIAWSIWFVRYRRHD
jgi:hypothetical protein